mgnify:CR=1 FL=1
MNVKTLIIPLFLVLFCCVFGCRNKQHSTTDESARDLPQIKDSGELVVLTLYSSTSYFIYRGQEMGFQYELSEQFAKSLGLKLRIEVAKSVDEMIQKLLAGEGDMIAYNLPITKEWKDSLLYCGEDVITHQVIVQQGRGKQKPLKDVTELVGKDIYVKPGKYYDRLVNLNSELGGGIRIHEVTNDSTTIEDLITQVAQGKIPYTVADNDLAKLNKTYYPNLNIDLSISFDQRSSWAVRKDSPYEIKYPVSRPMGTGSVSSAEKLLTTIKSMQPEQTPEADIKNQPEQPEEQILTQPEGIRKEPLPEQSKKETEKELAKEAYVLREEETYGAKPEGSYEQGSFLKEEEMAKQKIIGQLFDTYWLVEYNDRLFIVDQHAAHEKVMYEKLKKQFEKKEFTSQAISPPIVITLSMREAEVLERFKEQFTKLGFEIEHFGGAEYSICGVPGNLYRLNTRDVLIDMLDELTDGISERATADVILDKIASMSCKAAATLSCKASLKGNSHLSIESMQTIVDNLMRCDNPYVCPHGRPTIIAMSKYEIEKKFKRIV